MSDQQDPGAVVSLEDRLAQVSNQLTSARLLIDKAQTELVKIRLELAKQEHRHD